MHINLVDYSFLDNTQPAFRAEISAINPDGTYDLRTADGRVFNSVPASQCVQVAEVDLNETPPADLNETPAPPAETFGEDVAAIEEDLLAGFTDELHKIEGFFGAGEVPAESAPAAEDPPGGIGQH